MPSSKKMTCKGTLRQVFIRVYRLDLQSIMLVFSTSFVNYVYCPSDLLYGSPHPRGWRVLSLAGDHILRESNTPYLTRFRSNEIARR
jgi:hypothetical protein